MSPAARNPSALLLWSVLATCRNNRGWSQADLAERCHVPQSTVSKWESGRHGIGEATLVKVAAAYEIGVRELLLEGLGVTTKKARSR